MNPATLKLRCDGESNYFFNKGIVGMKAQSVFLTGNGLVIDSKFIL